MSVAAAQAAAGQLRTALLDHGVRQVSIELQPGVGSKLDPWGPAPFVRGLGHHIVSRPPGTPGLALRETGRTGANALQGPLCNGYGGFDLVARIITMGWANHPGEGGPWSAPGWGTVPKDNGRPYIFGWEFEGGIVPWTDEMHDFMARCGAGTLDWLGVLGRREPAPLECWGEHGHPWAEGRKIDRLGYTATSGRARIAVVRDSRTATKTSSPASITLQEDPVQLPVGQTVHMPVPKVPAGHKAYLTVTATAASGAVVYSKKIGRDRLSRPLLTDDKADGWLIWVAPGFHPEVDVTDQASVELLNQGAKNPAGPDKPPMSALAGAVISIVPA